MLLFLWVVVALAGAEPRVVAGGGIEVPVVAVAPGRFEVGAPGEGDNEPREVVFTRGFELMRTEVTQELWSAVMGSLPPQPVACPGCPVTTVSWDEATAFAGALSEKQGLSGDAAWRLPTEAEWEVAARAGGSSGSPGKKALRAAGWNEENSGGEPHPACEKPANAWGFCDLAGNAWEWTRDRYSATTPLGGPDPAGAETGSGRVIRGGSWRGEAWLARATYRSTRPPDYQNDDVGFRLARSAP